MCAMSIVGFMVWSLVACHALLAPEGTCCSQSSCVLCQSAILSNQILFLYYFLINLLRGITGLVNNNNA
jgi:hypothetical protein